MAIPRVLFQSGEIKSYLTIDLHFYPRTPTSIYHCVTNFLLMYDLSFLEVNHGWET